MPRKSKSALARMANLKKTRKVSANDAPAPNSAQNVEDKDAAENSAAAADSISGVQTSAPALVAAQDPRTTATIASSTPVPLTTTVDTLANGSFCLYSMNLPFLKDALVPNAKTGHKDYPALFVKIKESQNKPRPDRTAQCFLTFPSGSDHNYGRFNSCANGFIEPMGDEPYDVGISGLKAERDLVLPAPGSGGAGVDMKGVSGGLVLAASVRPAASSRCGLCPFGRGALGRKYGGHVVFNVKYGMYARKGHGSGKSVSFAFWAIRSMEGFSLEVGDVAHLANH
ncbi:hypothetical protein DXG03_001982 [Asterophora parasitica]|uniref:Uncharacterized protein n=1 Tax=Asterophora parasitica TaxID=117018 RepID=A0A9P7KGJ5_9AGAR|nr:hypothetical protein DXG03_001982 [Asterophora parasitica]